MVDTLDLLECPIKIEEETKVEVDDLDGIKPLDEEPEGAPSIADALLGNRISYSRDEILQFRNSPLSQARPNIENPSITCWKKVDDDLKVQIEKRKAVDPRERTKREGDGLILSPQRGANFKLGCSVAAPSPQPFQRRIGSGRLTNREWDPNENRLEDDVSGGRRKKFNATSSDDIRPRGEKPRQNGLFQDHGGRGARGRPTNGHAIFTLNSPPRGRYGNDRRSSGNEAPEWFTEGPTSRHDRIELHGFDGPESPEGLESTKQTSPVQPDSTTGPSMPDSDHSMVITDRSTVDSISEKLMQMDDWVPILFDLDVEVNPTEVETGKQQSRFSQFFNAGNGANGRSSKLSPGSLPESAQKLEDIERGVQNGQPGRPGPVNGDREAVMRQFSTQDVQTASAFISKLCVDQNQGSKLKDLAEALKIPSVDELEAQVLTSQQAQRPRPGHPHEIRFTPVTQVDQRSLLLNNQAQAAQFLHIQQHQFQQQQQQQHLQRQQQMMHAGTPAMGVLPTIPPDLYYAIAQSKPTSDIINRVDYITLINGVKQGVVTPQYLLNILYKSAGVINARYRDVILSVLHVIWASHKEGPFFGRETSQPPMQINGPPTRGDLAAHTASIMQNALIKRKLEEQRENFRRRQEPNEVDMSPRTISPNPSTGSPSLAFTPTAVLRKMTNPSQYPSNAPSPQPGTNSPLCSTPIPADVRAAVAENAALVMNHGYGQPGLPNPPMNPNLAHFGVQPLHMKPNFRQPVRACTPQAFIGQFAQARGAAPAENSQWWTGDGLVSQLNLGPNGAFAQAPMMTVEELERAQQRANDVMNAHRRARR